MPLLGQIFPLKHVKPLQMVCHHFGLRWRTQECIFASEPASCMARFGFHFSCHTWLFTSTKTNRFLFWLIVRTDHNYCRLTQNFHWLGTGVKIARIVKMWVMSFSYYPSTCTKQNKEHLGSAIDPLLILLDCIFQSGLELKIANDHKTAKIKCIKLKQLFLMS